MLSPDPDTSQQAMAAHFGSRLKYWRRTRRLTQVDLARQLDVDGSYISKLESSHRHATQEFAQKCDQLLDTGGELTGLLTLIEAERQHAREPQIPVPLILTSMTLSPTRDSVGIPQLHAGSQTPATLRHLLESYTEIDKEMGGEHISAHIEQQAKELVGMHLGEPAEIASRLLELAAAYGRLAGWIRFDTNDIAGAMFWFDCARRWAATCQSPLLLNELTARQAIAVAAGGDNQTALTLTTSMKNDTNNERYWRLAAILHAIDATDPSGAALVDEFGQLDVIRDDSMMAEPKIHTADYFQHSTLGKYHLRQALSPNNRQQAAETAIDHFQHAIRSTGNHHIRDLGLARGRMAWAQHIAGNTDAAANSYETARRLATQCSSGRLHNLLDTVRTQLGIHQTPGII